MDINKKKEFVIVTGGAGFIGSHTVVELLEDGYEVIIIDNLSNSSQICLQRIEEITKKKIYAFHNIDLLEEDKVLSIFQDIKNQNINVISVIHFAGRKAVGESTQIPINYYETNIGSTLNILKAMKSCSFKNLVFSSSATVYGDVPVDIFPKDGLTEDANTQSNNPYGRTKLFIEQILKDVYNSDKQYWNFVVLRYFNPVGSHSSGMIGEDPTGIPNNLMPFITQVAVGKRTHLSVFGNDYPTRDGTGIRDYIHVVDLAKGHIAAVKYQLKGEDSNSNSRSNYSIFNLGCGRGYSVIEVVEAFRKASKKEIPYVITNRRPGDVAIYLANVDKAKNVLNWKAEKSIDQMCEDSWRWQSKNPNGYDTNSSSSTTTQ